MLELVCKNSYVVFLVVSSGPDILGVQMVEGRNGKAKKAGTPDWFKKDESEALISFAALKIRAKLDREFYKPQQQLELFDAKETGDSLFDDEEEPTEHPLLSKALVMAQAMPPLIQWKMLVAAPLPCNVRREVIETRSIVKKAMVNTPAGKVWHIHCPTCKASQADAPQDSAAPEQASAVKKAATVSTPATTAA